MPTSLSSRLTLWYISAFSFFLITAFGIMYFTINQILDYRIDEDMVEDIEEFRDILESEGLPSVKREIDKEVQSGGLGSEFLRLTDSSGHLLYGSDMSLFVPPPGNIASPSEILASSNPTLRTVEREIVEDGESDEKNFREVVGQIGEGLFLHVGESMEEKEEMMDTLFFSFTGILILVLPFAGFVGWVMARRGVKGIEEVSNIAERIHRGQLDERVRIQATDREIVDLSSTFNAMLDRIKDLITEMREMTDNIAHDLKSPLARIRIISEEIISKPDSSGPARVAATQTIEECDRLLRMINDSLDVAEAEVGISGNGKELFDLSALTHDACELFEPVAEQKHITLESNIKSGCRFYGSEQVFQRTVSNLVDNAIKYTEQGGHVKLSLDFDDESCTISVSDTGIGVAEEDKKRIFNRFYRCDRSRTHEGCGLGLNYSRAIARTHGGDIAMDSTLNEGSTFTLTLPSRHLA